MAKNGSVSPGQQKGGYRTGAVRDRSQTRSPNSGIRTRSGADGRFIDLGLSKDQRREILFPTEPSAIGHKKIDRAIERVTSRRK